MAIIIQRTNPDFIAHSATWRCAACRSIHPSADAARKCATADHAKRNKQRKKA